MKSLSFHAFGVSSYFFQEFLQPHFLHKELATVWALEKANVFLNLQVTRVIIMMMMIIT